MIIIDDLPYEERLKYGNNNNNNKSCHLVVNKDAHYYKIEYTSRFTINNQLISYTQVENIVKLRLVDYSATKLQFDIVMLKNDIKNGLDFFPNAYSNVIKQMAKIKEHIICSIDSTGLVVAVHNTQEINQKWLLLKKSLLNNEEVNKFIQRDDLLKILDAGDKEYSVEGNIIISEMNQSVAFSALFTGFMDISNENIDRTYLSSIFPHSKIDVRLTKKEEYKETSTITYSLTDKAIKLDEDAFKKMFLKGYNFLNEKFDKLKFEYLCLSTVDEKTKWLVSNRFTISEQINSSLHNLIICEIDKIENYE